MKKPIIDEISVFFPAYNEEKNLKTTVSKSIEVLKSISRKWEVIIINDGSKDKTQQVAENIKSDYPDNISIITHSPNRGYGAALKSGLYNSKYQWIAFIDSDGQFDFAEINHLIKKQKETKADLVIGYYLGRKVPFYRKFGSQLWQLAVFTLFGLKVRDIDCGFKLINKKVVDAIPRLESERGPFISSEFLIHSKKAGFKIVEIGVNHYPRTAGEATGAKLSVVLAGFKDLFTLWKKINLAHAK